MLFKFNRSALEKPIVRATLAFSTYRRSRVVLCKESDIIKGYELLKPKKHLRPMSATQVTSPAEVKTVTGGPQTKRSCNPLVWVLTTYFAQGLPFMLVRILSSLYFTQLGVRELYLGYTNYLGLPWNLKFLWAPVIDGFSSKRRWQIALQLLLAALTFCIAYLSYLGAISPDPAQYLRFIAAVFVVMAFVAATNDVAIDGHYLEGLSSREEQALLSGYRVVAYRLAMVFARSGLVLLVAWFAARFAPISPGLAWVPAFVCAAVVLALLALVHTVILPPAIKASSIARNSLSNASIEGRVARAFKIFRDGFKSYLDQPKVWLVLSFIVFYKLGDEVLFSMVTPFLMRELKVSTDQYAWIGGIVGATGTIVGALVGGWWINRVGLRRAIWPLTLVMNLNIWLYVWMSVELPDPTTALGVATIAAIHGVEQIAAGVGSAVLLVFLLSTCRSEYRATHYAIGSAIMSLPGTIIGGEGGRFVELFGYSALYVAAFVLALPGMCLIPFVPLGESERGVLRGSAERC